MNEERTHILELLAKGKITVEEAQTLLEALAAGEKETDERGPFPGLPPKAPRPPRPSRPARSRRRRQGDLIDQVLELRIHGVDGHFIAEMKEMGFTDLTTDELVALRIHDVTPEYFREIRRAGFENVTSDELVTLAIHDVNADYVREMREAIGRDLTIDELVRLRIHDVTAEVFAEILSLGLVDVEATAKAGESDEDELA